MKAIASAMFLFILFPNVAVGESGGGEESSVRCQSLLDAADEAGRNVERVEEARALQEQALSVCPPARSLDVELGTRVALARARHLHAHASQSERAIKGLEETLEWLTAEVGLHHPSRIAILEEIASLLQSTSFRLTGAEASERRKMSRALIQEAIGVREAVYGSSTVEVAEGWLLLSASFMLEHPEVAEQHARRAYEVVVEAKGAGDAALLEPLSMLKDALERQGLDAEAEEVRDQMTLVARNLEKSEPGRE